MNERADLQRLLAEAEGKLEALPRADQVRHPHSVLARRKALEAKIKSLRQRISTMPVHNMLTVVETAAGNVHNGPFLDGPETPSARVANDHAQADPQPQR